MNEDRRHALRRRAEQRAAQRLLSSRDAAIFRPLPAGYTREPLQNLIPGMERNDFWPDLWDGAGNELVDSGRGPAKFCAAYSSSALAVNVFGPFRRRPQHLVLPECHALTELRFEKKLPTGLRGTDPHLDVFAAGLEEIVCIESKFLELLGPKSAQFADSYRMAIKSLAEDPWAAMYASLKERPDRYLFLDAAQLVKHYLGMRHSLAGENRKLQLMYLYWEPENAGDFAEYRAHRAEAEDFRAAVADSGIRFLALSYRQLWEEWRRRSGWSGMETHLDRLEQRYSFPL